MRTCTGCGESKPLTAYYMEKGKPRARCKECHKKKVAERDPERVREINAKSRAKFREKNAQRERDRRAREGDEINARRRQRWSENPDHYRAQGRAWRSANRDEIGERRRVWWADNKDLVNARIRADRKANPGKYRQQELANPNRAARLAQKRVYNRAYYEANKELFEIHRRKREARKAEVEFQPYTRREIFERDGGRCRGCDKPLENKPGGFQIDHIVPISLSGPDIPANVQLMCGPCNRAKWATLEGQIHFAA